MTLKRYGFSASIEPSDYREFVEQVAQFASFVGLVVDGDESRYSALALSVIDELRGEMVEIETHRQSWPGTLKILKADATRYIFSISSGSIETLNRSARTLFDWKNPRLPEDLHFMRADRSLVLGCVAHENDAWLELSDDEYGQWCDARRFPIHLENT